MGFALRSGWCAFWRFRLRLSDSGGVDVVGDRWLLMVAELSVVGVEKGFSCGGRRAGLLDDVSLEVRGGEVVAVVGRRLSGKTTLLRVMAGLECPDRGSVSLGGRDLAGLSDRERGRLLGQEVVWVDRDGPALDVEASRFVGWPLVRRRGRRRMERVAARMLERVGAGECVGRRWEDLSRLQRVRVGLARAFAGSPRVVIIDDLLDALGSRGTEEAFEVLRSLMEESESQCGVIMSASDMESAVFADRVWSLTGKGGLKPLAGPSDEISRYA
jgi:predicted ABC-type transport system involved in lysophospholipase L1 biosynthesis ATPase subunit